MQKKVFTFIFKYLRIETRTSLKLGVIYVCSISYRLSQRHIINIFIMSLLKRINSDINRLTFDCKAIMIFTIFWHVQPVEKLQVNTNLFGHFFLAFLEGKSTSDFQSVLKWNAKTYWKSENWSINDSCSALTRYSRR